MLEKLHTERTALILDSRLSGQGSTPWLLSLCQVLGQHSPSTSPHPGLEIGTVKLNAWCNPVMDKHHI